MGLVWSKRELSLYLLIIFYIVAGLNHLLMPDFYLPLIPYEHPSPKVINIIVGLLESGFGVLLLFRRTREFAAYGIFALLVIFIPVHVVFIRDGGCFDDFFCLPLWVAHVRLWVVHPLLLYWAWVNRKNPVKIL